MIKISMMNLSEDCLGFKSLEDNNIFLYKNRIDVQNVKTKQIYSIKLNKKVSEIDRTNYLTSDWIICSNYSFQYLLNIKTFEMMKMPGYRSVFGSDVPMYACSEYVEHQDSTHFYRKYDIIRLYDKFNTKSYEIKHKYKNKIFNGYKDKIIFEEEGVLNILNTDTDEVLLQKDISAAESILIDSSIITSDAFYVNVKQHYGYYSVDYCAKSLVTGAEYDFLSQPNVRRFYQRTDEAGNNFLIAVFVKDREQYIYCYDINMELKAKLKPTIRMSSISSSQIRVSNNALVVYSLTSNSNGKSFMQFQKDFN